jgi:hypothetical protein
MQKPTLQLRLGLLLEALKRPQLRTMGPVARECLWLVAEQSCDDDEPSAATT